MSRKCIYWIASAVHLLLVARTPGPASVTEPDNISGHSVLVELMKWLYEKLLKKSVFVHKFL